LPGTVSSGVRSSSSNPGTGVNTPGRASTRNKSWQIGVGEDVFEDRNVEIMCRIEKGACVSAHAIRIDAQKPLKCAHLCIRSWAKYAGLRPAHWELVSWWREVPIQCGV
jgi:hypothetical protein